MQHDPSRTSFYVGNEFYQTLTESFKDWQIERLEVTDLVPECVYWVPATEPAGDPRTEIAVCFDDRRRIEDRIFRLQNEFAWSQQPRSRTARLISNVEVFSTENKNILMLRATFLITEFQAGDKRTYSGWYGHKIRYENDKWNIVAKQVNLINCDQILRNLSIIL